MKELQRPIDQLHAVASIGEAALALPPSTLDGDLVPSPAEVSPDESINVIEVDEVSPTFLGKLRTVAGALRNDWKRETNAGKVWLSLAMVGQAGERTHLMTEATIAPAAAHILRTTHSPWLTGFSVLGMVGVAQEGIAATWVEGMHRAPKTSDAISTQFPRIIEAAEDLGADKERHWYSGLREGASSFALYGVTPYVVAEKLADPETTRKQSHITAAIMTGKCAVAGFMVGFGAGELAVHNPEVGNRVVGWLEKPWIWWGIAGVIEGPRLIGKRLQRRSERRALARAEQAEGVQPRYDLNETELQELETDFISTVKASTGEEFCAAWVSPTSKFANFIRTKEVKEFPEAEDVDSYYDEHQEYLALVDLRGGGRIVHAASIMDFDAGSQNTAAEHGQRTGFYTIDSLIERGNFTKEEFVKFYELQGVDLDTTISVETNFKIRKNVEHYLDLGTADLTYLTLFNRLIDKQAPRDNTVVFASINDLQAGSLDRMGIKYSPLMGRSDFDTEEGELGKDSYPVAIDFASAYDILAPLQMKLAEVKIS